MSSRGSVQTSNTESKDAVGKHGLHFVHRSAHDDDETIENLSVAQSTPPLQQLPQDLVNNGLEYERAFRTSLRNTTVYAHWSRGNGTETPAYTTLLPHLGQDSQELCADAFLPNTSEHLAMAYTAKAFFKSSWTMTIGTNHSRESSAARLST